MHDSEKHSPGITGPVRTHGDHSVILYGRDERRLLAHVTMWLCEHLARECPVFVVATAPHRRAFEAALRQAGVDMGAMRPQGLYASLDAATAAGTIVDDGEVSWRAFNQKVGERVRNLRMRGPLRVYGEMVDLLWGKGDRETALDLELFWNRLQARVDFELLCSYGIDAEGSEFALGDAEGIIRAHSSVVPYRSGDSLP